MATYKVTDPTSGKTLRLTGDSPPTEQELNEIFSSVGSESVQRQSVNRVDQFLPKEQEVEAITSKRQDSFQTLKEEMAIPFKGGLMQKGIKAGVTGLKAAAIPLQRAESTVAGMGLGLQKGSLSEGFKRAKMGFIGERNQQLGDIIRTTGVGGEYNEPLARGVGFTAALISPLKMVKDGLKLMSKVEKFSDKKLLTAGNNLINGSDEAVRTVGAELDKVYAPINSVKVAPDKVLNEFSKLPQPVIQHIETELGQNLDEALMNFDIAKARQLKKVLGKLKPSSYGKAQRGAIETVMDEQVNRAYASVKQSMQEGLINSGLKKNAKSLLEADEAFAETQNASNYIKNIITEKTLRKPTKAGVMASKIQSDDVVSARQALNTLKSVGGKARNSINKAVIELENYNRLKSATGLLKGAGRTIGYGVIGGGVAGKILEGVQQ